MSQTWELEVYGKCFCIPNITHRNIIQISHSGCLLKLPISRHITSYMLDCMWKCYWASLVSTSKKGTKALLRYMTSCKVNTSKSVVEKTQKNAFYAFYIRSLEFTINCSLNKCNFYLPTLVMICFLPDAVLQKN